jgi:SAM-dependent methyltransferase
MQNKCSIEDVLTGPFGPSHRVLSLSREAVAEAYERKCGVNVRSYLAESLHLYECQATGYRFWRPTDLAGNEEFYRSISAAWPNYYRENRWEYQHVLPLLNRQDSMLEVGCGRGFFLRLTESEIKSAVGLELNREAIKNKVTAAEVLPLTVREMAARKPAFDVVCAFQVLEHISEPADFIQDCLDCLDPRGRLIFSTPNHDHVPFQNREDAFDMPPHHMGHFSPQVYAKIGERYGLVLEQAIIEPRQARFESVAESTRSQLSYRLIERVGLRLLSRIYRSSGEPGPSVLAVFRRA